MADIAIAAVKDRRTGDAKTLAAAIRAADAMGKDRRNALTIFALSVPEGTEPDDLASKQRVGHDVEGTSGE